MKKSRLSLGIALYAVLAAAPVFAADVPSVASLAVPSDAASAPPDAAAVPSGAAAVPPDAAASTQSNSGSTATLQGGVEHSVTVAPVPLALMQGAKFDENALPKLTPGNVWYQIPTWLAGTWQFKTETVTDMYVYDQTKYPPTPFTLQNEFQRTIGYQKDKKGQIWDYIKAPFSYTAKVGRGLVSYINESSILVIRSNDGEVVRRLTGQDAVVDPDTQEILLSNQKECFIRYTPAGDDGVRVDGSTKIFDMNGKAKVLKLSNLMAVKLKDFQSVDEKDGQNLKEMFAQFLKSQGKADLVP